MQGDGEVARFAYQFQGIVDGHVGGVALGTGGEVYGGFCQGDTSFGPSHFHQRVEAGVGKQQRVGVGQSDVFGGGDDEAAGYEGRVLTAFYHACQPVDGAIRVAAANGFDEGGDDVVVHLAVLIVGKRVLLQAFGHHVVGDEDRVCGFGVYHQLEDVE